MKTFLDDLKNALVKMNIHEDKINDILSDMQEMINSAREEGVSDDELYAKLGDPTKLAKELSEIEPKNHKQEDVNANDGVYTFESTGRPLSIKTKLVNEDVIYRFVDGDLIKVILENDAPSKKYTITYENDVLSIQTKHNKTGLFGFSFSRSSAEICVEIPKTVILHEFHHNCVNGDINMIDMNMTLSKISSVEGDVHVENTTFASGHIHTVNGDININQTHGKTLHINTVNGDVYLNKLIIEADLTIQTVSGDVDAKDSSVETLYSHAVSGDTKGKEFYLKKLSYESVSGDFMLNNTRKEVIDLIQKKTLSGEIKL